MELAHSVNLSHWEVSDVDVSCTLPLQMMLFFCMYRSSTVSDGQSSEFHHHDCLLE